MKKINIAIVGWKTGENSFGVTIPYLEYFSKFGQVHVLTPAKFDHVYRCDLLVLPGGRDVNPARYNRTPSYYTGHPEPILEWFDKYLLPKYINAQIPIFGICRGHQTLAVHFGLPLIQHLPYHPSNSGDRSKTVHEVYLPSQMNSTTYKFPKLGQFATNSMHHQGVAWTEFSDETVSLVPTLVSDDYIVEAMRHKELPIHSVQWHPEELEDDYSESIIKNLLEWKKK